MIELTNMCLVYDEERILVEEKSGLLETMETNKNKLSHT